MVEGDGISQMAILLHKLSSIYFWLKIIEIYNELLIFNNIS